MLVFSVFCCIFLVCDTNAVICSVFEAFGKIRSCKLAPDMLRPGKHRQVDACVIVFLSHIMLNITAELLCHK